MAPDAPQLHLTRQRPAPRAHQPRRPGRDGRRRRHRRVRGRHAGPGVPRARSPGSRCPTARAASTSTSRRSGCTSTATSCAESLGLPHEKVRLTMGGVGGAFGGREDLSMQVHACMLALHTGRPVQDGLQPRGVVLRPRPPPPVHDALRARRHRGRRPRLRPRADRARRRRVRLVARPRSCSNAACFAAGPYDVPNARIDAYVDVHEQPAVRRDARLRRGAGRVRPRGADGQARGGARHGPGRPADPQRDGARHAACRPARSCPSRRRWPSCSSACARCRCRPTAAGAERDLRELPGGVVEHDPRRGRASRRRLRGRLQERRLLRGLRRLLDRPRAPVGRRRRAARRGPHGRRRGRPGRRHGPGADRADRARRRARRGAHRGHPGRARPGRAPPRARPT